MLVPCPPLHSRGSRVISVLHGHSRFFRGWRSFDSKAVPQAALRSLLRSAATLALVLCALFTIPNNARSADSPRQVIAKALVSDDADEQAKLVGSLAGTTDDNARTLLTAWKEGSIYLYVAPVGLPGFVEGAKIPLSLAGEKDAEGKQLVTRIDTAEPLKDAEGNAIHLAAGDLDAADTTGDLRVAMKSVLDLFALSASDSKSRLNVISQMGLAQDPAILPALQTRQKSEADPAVQRALRDAIDQIRLKSEDPQTQIAAANELGSVRSIPSRDALLQLSRDSESTQPAVATAARKAMDAIDTHLKFVNFYGTIFRGISTGSVLLVIAIGLAITFGLMGVINMAHGELIAVGAYTAYVVQCIFGPGLALNLTLPFTIGNKTVALHIDLPAMHLSGAAYDSYFIVAIPLSFLMAALVGLALERCVIQWLYRRPLESLLATWGVSLVLQQLFRSTFGSNNVQVDSPGWLSGNWTFFDVIFGWNRVFVIAFAISIIFGTWAILNKTPLGLLIRAVMQNRQMAACMGVRTERVNMLTFAFGSGLAGLAGAFLSQLGNVGPGMGQDHIVDAFMTVVVGGVGSIFGTVVSALSIGVADNALNQTLGSPVLGKILVLVAIIFFLQWRPSGLFVTKSRSLEG
jgi:urea transport system permease protein